MNNLQVSSSIATEIAQVDKQRLNEAIAAGLYPCAPKTVASAPPLVRRERHCGAESI